MAVKRRWPAGILAALTLSVAAALAVSWAAPVAATAAGGAPAAAGATGTPGDTTGAGESWWAHVKYLADDRLEGRLTGSAGYRQAAAYVAERFQEYGLAPAGDNGYFQPVRFDV
ncbi:MAG TPA: hypothetical protein VKY89_13135, partial [Thermoanaerobaculia bacterium]|nr:hypothetical protein [Thermoanaerobaculia bacterium]